MRFECLIQIAGNEPLFETGLLLTPPADPADVHRQLTRWAANGRVVQLRRGLYALAPPWRKHLPHPFLTANRLVPGSYVSGLSALAFAGAIPEYVPEVTSVGRGRSHSRRTPLGRFSFRHLQPALHFGYRHVDLGNDQSAFVARPEKALLDLVHQRPGGEREEHLGELRLNFDALDLDALDEAARVHGAPKLQRAAAVVRRLAEGAGDYEPP